MTNTQEDTGKRDIFRCFKLIKKPGRRNGLAFSVVFVIGLMLTGSHVFGQDRGTEKTLGKVEKEALALFRQGDFVKALPLYSQLLSLDPKNPDLNYRFGVCLLQGDRRDMERPLKFLEKAVKAPGIEPEAVFYLGLAYHYNYRFSDAITQFEQYKKLADAKTIKELGVERQIEMCKNGFMLLSNVSDIYVMAKTEVSLLDFYRAYRLKDFGGEFLYKPDIFKSKIDRKKNDKSVVFFPKVLDEVFFSSYGEDLKHGRDIFHAFRQPDGSWGKPIRLVGKINTEYDEDYPYLLPDGKTLYFCSKGHNSMGGYDIFRSRLDTLTGQWGEPENLDFAINTPFDDLLFVTDKSKRIAFFASNRSSPGDQVTVYKVRIDSRPEKQQDITLEPLLAGQESKKADYERSLSIIKEMSKLDVNMQGEFQPDTLGDAGAAIPPVIIVEKKPEPTVPVENLQQRLERKIIQKKQSQARVDTAFAIVGSLERSQKAFEEVREKVQISADKVVNPREKALANAVVKDLVRNEKVKRARLENARYRAGSLQQLVSTQKVDSADKAFLAFKRDIKAEDTLTDFSGKFMSDLKLAIASPKNKANTQADFFTGEEFTKVRKDSAFLLSFIERSTSIQEPGKEVAATPIKENINQAIADSAFAIVSSLERSQQAFETTREQIIAEQEKVVAPREIPLAKAIVKELDKHEKVMQAKLSDARKQANIIQNLVTSRQADSAEKVYDVLVKKIKPADTLKDYTGKLQADLKLAVAEPKKNKQPDALFFTGDEFRKIKKDTVFLMSFIERSAYGQETAASVPPKRDQGKESQAIVDSAFLISPVERTTLESKPETLAQDKLVLTGAITAERIVLENYKLDLGKRKFKATEQLQQNLDKLEQTISTYHESSAKKLSRNESPEQREEKLRVLQDEAIRLAARVKVSNSYVVIAKRTETQLQQQIHQLDSVEAIAGQIKAGKDVKAINILLGNIKAKNIDLISPETINQKLRQQVALESKPLIATASANKKEAIQKSIESVMLDSLGVVLSHAADNAGDTPNKKDIVSTIKSLNASSVETGIASGIAMDSYRTHQALAEQVAVTADSYDSSLEQGIPAPVAKQKEISPEKINARLSGLEADLMLMSPAVASINLIQDPQEVSKRIRLIQTETAGQAVIAEKESKENNNGKDSLMKAISLKYSKEIALVEEVVKPTNKKELNKVEPKQEDPAKIFQPQQDDALKARNENLSKTLSEGVEKIDRLMDQEISPEIGQEIERKLDTYKVIADTALKHLAAEIEAQQLTKGSSNDIAMFLELKEYEIRASRNRSIYLANKLKSAQLSREAGDIALLSSASLMESEADIFFSKAWLLRDSASRSEAFLIQKLLYHEAIELEDTAIVRQEHAISIKKDALAQQQIAIAKQDVKQDQSKKIPGESKKQQIPKQEPKQPAIIRKQEKIETKQPVVIATPDKEALKQPAINTKNVQPEPQKAIITEKPEILISSEDTAKISFAANRLIKELPESSRAMAEKLVKAMREQKLPTINGMYYTVQVGVYATPRNSAQLKNINPLLEDRMKNGHYRYFSGIYGSREAAVQAKNQIIIRGIPDAFVVAVYNGMKLSLAEAKAYEPQSIVNQIKETKLDQLVKVLTIPAGKPELRVQLGAFRKALSPEVLADFSLKAGGKVMTQLSATGLTLVFSPAYDNLGSAAEAKLKVVEAGIKDAFIIGFIGGERTTAAKVKELLKTKTP